MQIYATAAGYDSGCVVIWNDLRLPAFGLHVYGARLDIFGDTIGGNFRVNDDTLNGCLPFPCTDCDLQGNFGVTWKQGHSVRLRRFQQNGTPLGPSILVNTSGGQTGPPTIAMDSLGFTVVSWSDNHDNYAYRVYGQIYDESGTTIGPNFAISDSSSTMPMLTAVEIGADRSISVVWHAGNSIWCQRFDSLGTQIGGNFVMWTDTLNAGVNFPCIKRNADGDYLLAWSTGQRGNVFCRLLDSTFAPQSGAIRMNDLANDEAWRPKIHHRDSTWYVVFENGNSAVCLQLLDHEGTPIGNNILINEPVGIWNFHPGIAVTDELINISWTRRKTNPVWDIMVQNLDLDGSLIGTNKCISDDKGGAGQSYPAIIADTNGCFFVVWDDHRDSLYNYSFQYARIFDAQGNPLLDDFQINENIDAMYPAISLNALGLYVTTWTRELADSSRQIFGQRLDRNGTCLGPNFQISNAPGNNGIFFSKITALSDNRFATIWTDYRFDPYRICGRILDPLGIPQGSEFTTYIDSTAYNIAGALVDEENGKFIIAMSCSRDTIGVAIQEFDYSGNPVSTTKVLNETAAEYVLVSGAKGVGKYLFVWGAFDGTRISGQLLDDSLHLIGCNFEVSDNTISSKGFPSVVSNSEGRFFVLWQDSRNEDTDIYGQFLEADGSPIGSNFKVDNDTTHSEQWLPSCYSANDLIYAVWSDARNPAQGYDIYCKTMQWPPTYVLESQKNPVSLSLCISPNPFHNRLNIDYPMNPRMLDKTTIDIFNSCGRLVRRMPLHPIAIHDNTPIEWNGTDTQGNILPAGVYFIVVRNETATYTQKVIKIN